MQKLLILLLVVWAQFSFTQVEPITIVEAVTVLDDHMEEAVYYYQNNWKILRDQALMKKYIHSYEMIISAADEEADFDILLITRYRNQKQFAEREAHFKELIDAKGELQLLNDLEPSAFRQNGWFKQGRSIGALAAKKSKKRRKQQ